MHTDTLCSGRVHIVESMVLHSDLMKEMEHRRRILFSYREQNANVSGRFESDYLVEMILLVLSEFVDDFVVQREISSI